MYLLTWWGESHSGDAQSCALRLSVCLSLSLFEQKYNSEPQDVANKSFNYCYISLNSFGFNETAFSGAKHLIEKFPSSSCVYILFKHYRLLGSQLEKNNASKHFILSLILFKLWKPVTYDSNYTFYIFGFILNNKPQLGYLNWFFLENLLHLDCCWAKIYFAFPFPYFKSMKTKPNRKYSEKHCDEIK